MCRQGLCYYYLKLLKDESLCSHIKKKKKLLALAKRERRRDMVWNSD